MSNTELHKLSYLDFEYRYSYINEQICIYIYTTDDLQCVLLQKYTRSKKLVNYV